MGLDGYRGVYYQPANEKESKKNDFLMYDQDIIMNEHVEGWVQVSYPSNDTT